MSALARTSERDGRTRTTNENCTANESWTRTKYKYDLLGNLIQVMDGTQTRQYSYDTLSRIVQSSVPESGSTYFYFTTSAGSLCAADTNAVCRRTDARSITTTYSYDALNRLTGKNYSDTTPTVSYHYDQSSYNGLTISNGLGKLTGMNDGAGAVAWSYAAAGHILTERRLIAGITKTISYTYNLDGSLQSLTYPSNRVITYGVGNAQRSQSAIDSTGSQYAIAATYAPFGAISSATYAKVTGGFGGITRTDAYNNRLERSSSQASSTAGTALNLGFCDGTFTFSGGCSSPSTNNNGSISGFTNSVDSGRSVSTAYDSLNRIQSATSQATSGSDCWGQSFTIDGWGNLTGMSATQCSGGSLNVSANGNNQLVSTGFAYDTAGNMTNDGEYAYSYDAENRITSAASVTYTYDGNGLRVEKSNGTLYWRTTTGDAIAETDLSGNTKSEYVFFSDRRIAHLDSSGNVYYYFGDQLGTTRTMTTSSGAVCYDAEFTPFGQEMAHANSCPQNYKFTGFERDAETGLDYSFARYYNPRFGRFMSADPLGADSSDPQSLNRYAYVLNNPPNEIDPSGLLGVKVLSVPDDFFGDGCSMNGVAIACSVLGGVIGGGGAAACPNNACSGFGVDANGNTVFAQFYAFAGGTSGYYNPSDIAQGVWEWNGQLLTAQGYNDYVIEPYEDKMAAKVAADLGIPASNVTASGVGGGNANFQIDENTWAEESSSDGCSSEIGPGIRCGFAPSLHFESGLDSLGNMIYWVHMDTANPATGLLGLVIHGFVDFFLGNTVFSSGVPH